MIAHMTAVDENKNQANGSDILREEQRLEGGYD
jgi:hypothetical protein